MCSVRVHDWNPWSEMNRMVVGAGARDEPADRVVGLPEDVGDLLPDPRVLVLGVVGMVGRDVVRQRVLGPVVETHTEAIRSQSELSIRYSETAIRFAVTSKPRRGRRRAGSGTWSSSSR